MTPRLSAAPLQAGKWTLLLSLALGCAEEPENEPDFSQVYEEVLSLSCAFSSCHGGGTSPHFGDLDSAYEALVNEPSSQADGEILVTPGDAESSYLVKKLDDADGIEGDAMPPSQQLSQDKIDTIRAWIEAGAVAP